ncbi:MAG TPA: FtsW/RodA/SpoVE family cell cycle protein, partial [Gemmatimonadaceae bacterium]
MATSVADVRYRWYMGPEARLLLLITACLLAFGLATVHSASAMYAQGQGYSSSFFFVRQLGGIAVGMIALAVFAKVDADIWSRYAWPIMLLAIVLLTIVILPFTESIAPRIHGSRRFLIGSSLQPSEFGKIAVIFWTSMLVVKKGETLRRLTKGLLPFLVIVGILDVLVALEPDLSVAMMYTLIMGIILFAGGVRIGHFVVLGIVAIPLLWNQVQRL